MVGAGGIGCELLKNLVLMGFGEIHVVDLDTIDLSNLNRQFLFRHEHIKQPKAHVARESALKFNPHVKIESYHANIMDSQFDAAWFKSFGIVFNALDNMDARRYVNEKCISLGVPLVESGTTGFAGQSAVIKKGVTECYDCYGKETPKSFPVCTIRSTPSQPIHCIVWAKSYLFTEIFGTGAEETSELDFAATGENAAELKKLKEETLALQKIRSSMGSKEFPKLIFDKVFKDDIVQIVSLSEKWKGMRGPQALDFEALQAQSQPEEDLAKKDQIVWSESQAFQVFLDSLHRLADRALALKASGAESTLDFDKDDDDTLDFVAAAANLRSYIFGIVPQSKFDIKQMAGNIIPAIATTNAIIAGTCVLQALKVLRDNYDGPTMFSMTKSTDRLMNSYRSPPNPDCPVCSIARTNVKLDPSKATLGNVVDSLQKDLGYDDFSLYSQSHLLYEPDDEDLEENLTKLLVDLDINDNSTLRIEGENRVDLVMTIQSSTNEDVAIEKVAIPEKPADKPAEQHVNGVVPVTNGHVNGNSGTKRKAEDDLLEQPVPKKTTNIVVDDDIIITGATGPILIDD
jgi:ubiquitin-like 1-activating enzyme E1 B